MGKDRQGRLLSYLALAIIMVIGALAHGLPASAANSQVSWRLDSVFDAGGAADHGILPSPLQPRDLREQRSPRASLDNGADSDTLAASFAGPFDPVGRFSFFFFDSERAGASTPRLAHRPRDPPRLS